MKEDVPESAVLCLKCENKCYWDTENQNLVCIGCGAHYKGEDFGIESVVKVES